jgi:diacylglycerol kinase family enzyme
VGDAEVDRFETADRLADLNGKRIGLFWNGKPNGDLFLNRFAERLKARFDDLTVVRLWEVEPGTRTALGNTTDHLKLMAREADLVLAASGD